MLLGFQEYVCFLIKGTNTTGPSPDPARSGSGRLAAAGEKGPEGPAGSHTGHPVTADCPEALFGEQMGATLNQPARCREPRTVPTEVSLMLYL